jgi:hypothetical protein
MEEPTTSQQQRLRSVGEIIDGCSQALDRTARADWARAAATCALVGNLLLLNLLIASYLYLQFFGGGC